MTALLRALILDATTLLLGLLVIAAIAVMHWIAGMA